MAGIIFEHDSRHPKHPDYGKSERESAALKKLQEKQLAEIKAKEGSERESAVEEKAPVKVPERKTN